VLAAAGVLRRSRRTLRASVFALSASAWSNALPLLVIAGSAEFRYLLWTVLASLLAVLAAWCPMRHAAKTSRGFGSFAYRHSLPPLHPVRPELV